MSKAVGGVPVYITNTLTALTRNVTFMTVPVTGTSTDPTYGSIVNINAAQSPELFAALKDDTIDQYLKKYPDSVLKPAREVS